MKITKSTSHVLCSVMSVLFAGSALAYQTGDINVAVPFANDSHLKMLYGLSTRYLDLSTE